MAVTLHTRRRKTAMGGGGALTNDMSRGQLWVSTEATEPMLMAVQFQPGFGSCSPLLRPTRAAGRPSSACGSGGAMPGVVE